MTSPELIQTSKDSEFRTLAKGVFLSLASESHRYPISRHDTIDDRVTVHVEHNGASDTVINYFMGYRQQMIPVKNAVQPYIGEAGTVRYFSFPGGYYSDASLEDAILESAQEDEGMTKKVIGVSNGGKEALHQYAKPEILQQIPYVQSWNMDSTPGDFSDIRWLYRRLLTAGERLDENSPVHQRLFLAAMNLGLPRLENNDPVSAADLARNVTRSTANTPLGSSRSQLVSLKRPIPDSESMARLGLQIGEVNYVASSSDPVVNTTRSRAHIQTELQHPVNFVIDPNRPARNHAGITDTPQFIAKLVKHGVTNIAERKELTDV